MQYQSLIPEVDKSLIKNELTKERFLRTTRKGGNEIYCVNIHNAPNCLREIGRLREVTFRQSGGGTGAPFDLDEYDLNDPCYQQLIVWSPEDEEIVGGYRYILCKNAMDSNGIHLSTKHYFDFSEEFISNYLPYTIELGRSWVQPNFQPAVNPRKGLFALDNIWDGLGALVIQNPTMKYFFGKVTMYPTFNQEARDFLLHFMHHYFPDNEKLMHPFHPLIQKYDPTFIDEQLSELSFKDGFKVLNSFVRLKGKYLHELISFNENIWDCCES